MRKRNYRSTRRKLWKLRKKKLPRREARNGFFSPTNVMSIK